MDSFYETPKIGVTHPLNVQPEGIKAIDKDKHGKNKQEEEEEKEQEQPTEKDTIELSPAAKSHLSPKETGKPAKNVESSVNEQVESKKNNTKGSHVDIQV